MHRDGQFDFMNHQSDDNPQEIEEGLVFFYRRTKLINQIMMIMMIPRKQCFLA